MCSRKTHLFVKTLKLYLLYSPLNFQHTSFSSSFLLNEMELPKTFIDQWTNKDVATKIKYNQLGQTDMWVSQLSLGMINVCLLKLMN